MSNHWVIWFIFLNYGQLCVGICFFEQNMSQQKINTKKLLLKIWLRQFCLKKSKSYNEQKHINFSVFWTVIEDTKLYIFKIDMQVNYKAFFVILNPESKFENKKKRKKIKLEKIVFVLRFFWFTKKQRKKSSLSFSLFTQNKTEKRVPSFFKFVKLI